MRAANIVGIIIIIILAIILFGMLMWHQNIVDATGASVVNTENEKNNLESQISEKNREISKLSSENEDLKDDIEELEEELHTLQVSPQASSTADSTSSSSSGSSNDQAIQTNDAMSDSSNSDPAQNTADAGALTLDESRELLNERLREGSVQGSIQLTPDDEKNIKLISDKKASILNSNKLLQSPSQAHRVIEVCQRPGDDLTLYTRRKIDAPSFENAKIIMYDSQQKLLEKPIIDASKYEEDLTLVCVS